MSHNGNPRFSAPNAGGDCRENDMNSQPKFAALAESQQKKDFSPPAISSGSSPSSRQLSPETTIQKMREFQGEKSIYEASIDSLTVVDDYRKANPFMSVAQLKEAHAELKQRSSPEKEEELITRYEELSSKKAEEAKEDPMLGVVLDNRYKINGLVGSGANATVYKAKRLSDGEIVAVKTIRNRGIEEIWRFKLEIESMRRMQHENLVNYIDCIVQEKGRIFLVMELVQGISLQEVLSLHGPITDEETICHILAQVVDALAHAHEKGIIHRDLKTGNIILSKRKDRPMHVKVLDFGLAKHKTDEAAKITMHGKTLGSPLYMSPEQCRGEEPTIQSDIYSLGVLAYELMTGIVPFIGETIPEIMAAHCDPDSKHVPLKEICPNLSGVDHLDRILSKALAKEAKHRFRRVTRFKQALEFWIEGVRKGAYSEERHFDAIIKDRHSIYQNINEHLRRSLEVTKLLLPIYGGHRQDMDLEDITLLLDPQKGNRTISTKSILISVSGIVLIVVSILIMIKTFTSF